MRASRAERVAGFASRKADWDLSAFGLLRRGQTVRSLLLFDMDARPKTAPGMRTHLKRPERTGNGLWYSGFEISSLHALAR
ncbi:hypothetical protein WJX84_010600 [Apatococcus fuscideae]|uniref:Uncharacterized protein n=1 Tax=Apatococcus fuscideae TaxID=2026836 RepID=A0AAW1TA47_9CHLO